MYAKKVLRDTRMVVKSLLSRHRDTGVFIPALITNLHLETGLKKSTILGILEDMEFIKEIKMKEGRIFPGEKLK